MSALYRFTDTIRLGAPCEDVFGFYTKVENLQRLLSPNLVVRVLRADSPLRLGARVEFDVGPRNIPLSVRWVSEISAFEPPAVFEDSMVNGPFTFWKHRHLFAPIEGGGTAVTDTLEVGAGRGILGQAVNSILLGRNIEELFAFRRAVLEDQFGRAHDA